jgi:hypothetical protein
MTLAANIAKHLREVHFGGNWTSVSLKDQLADVTWHEAATTIGSMNSIVTLVYHTGYYIAEVTKVLQGQPLQASDKKSFEHEPLTNEEDWQQLLATTWVNAEVFATLIEQLPDNLLLQDFTDAKYGSYYRNLHGIIEHLHYHMGQIVLLKKVIREHS